jgi:hypothetical protein
MKNLIFIFFILASVSLSAQILTPAIDSIPTQDGKKLAADIYLPDTSGGKTYPTILIHTPYNRLFYRWSLPLVGTDIANSPFIFVIVDWRCFYGSAAACAGTYDRGLDGYDAVEWISAMPWSDGQVATWGPSALGKIQFETAKHNPPHLVCCVPLVAAPQMMYEIYFPGGCAREEYIEQLDALGYGMSPILYANTHYNLLWAYSESTTFYPDSIHVPMLMIGGWYDHNPNEGIAIFEGMRLQSDIAVRDKHKILMGPWVHGGHGAAYVGSNLQGQLNYPAAAGWQDSLAWRFFGYYLLGEANGYDTLNTWMYFQMGEDNWHSTNQWPESGYNDFQLYMHASGLLMSDQAPNTIDSLSFNYDPADPSPTVGGPTLRTDQFQGPYDQTDSVESRNDILVFTTPELSFDVAVQGYPKCILYVSSDRKDTDFAVRLTDVYPDGRSMLLLDGIHRMRFRNGYQISDTAFMQTGNVYQVEIEMNPTSHTFVAGHKIRVDISSANYPRFNANMNDGGEMYVSGDTLIAHNTVFCNSTYPSHLVLPLMSFPSTISEMETEKLNVYPNPFTDVLNLEIPRDWQGQNLRLEIFGKDSKLVYSQESLTGNAVQVAPTLASGQYLMILWNGEFSKSCMIQRY